MGLEIITNFLDKIPIFIAGARGILEKLLTALRLPDNSFALVAIVLSLFASYFFLKQWIMKDLFFKLSTILNYILLSIIFYLVITKV